MPRVRFLKDFDWKPLRSVTFAFKAGSEHLVTTRCAQAAIAKGRAEPVKKRRKAETHEEAEQRG